MDEAWERAVEAACGGEEAQSVRSLTLDGAVKCSQGRLPTRSLLERFTQLRVLSIANVGLTSLADFPSLPHLQRLVLSDNRISGGLEFLVSSHLQSLCDLDLSNNKIQSFDELAPLAQLELLSLDLYECPITRVEDYRGKVFRLIKSLQYLDKVDAEDNERPESDEEEEDHDDDGEDDGEDDGVDDEEPAHTGDKVLTSNGRVDQVDEEDEEDDGETSDELDEEDEENDLGVNHVEGTNDVSGSEEEVDDEEETEQVLEEVQDIDESEDEEEDDEEDGTEQASPEISEETDAQGEGEEDNSEVGDEDEEGDEGVEDEEEEEDDDDDDEEEDLGTEYLVQPIAQAEDEEAASDFEPGEDDSVEDDDDIDEFPEDDLEAAASTKRKRSKEEDDEEKQQRPPKK